MIMLISFVISITDIGLPSGKSLFQIQAERILCVQRLAAQVVSEGENYSWLLLYVLLYQIWHSFRIISLPSGPIRPVTIHWYIMTSPFTDEATRKYFSSHKYFGLEPDQVRFFFFVWSFSNAVPFVSDQILITLLQISFFQQGTLPCISKDGKFIMETPFSVCKIRSLYFCFHQFIFYLYLSLITYHEQLAKAPDGNGGVYAGTFYYILILFFTIIHMFFPKLFLILIQDFYSAQIFKVIRRYGF